MTFRLPTFLLTLAVLLAAIPAFAERHRPGGPRRAAASPPASSGAEAPGAEASVESLRLDLSAYRLLTIGDLRASEEVGTGKQSSLPLELSERLASAVGEAEGLDLEVRRGEPLGLPGELVLSGTVVHARKGSRAARIFVGPFARARLVVELALRDGRSGELLDSGTVKKLWAMPGWSGAIRGLEGLENGVCRELVRYLEEAEVGSATERAPVVASAEPPRLGARAAR